MHPSDTNQLASAFSTRQNTEARATMVPICMYPMVIATAGVTIIVGGLYVRHLRRRSLNASSIAGRRRVSVALKKELQSLGLETEVIDHYDFVLVARFPNKRVLFSLPWPHQPNVAGLIRNLRSERLENHPDAAVVLVSYGTVDIGLVDTGISCQVPTYGMDELPVLAARLLDCKNKPAEASIEFLQSGRGSAALSDSSGSNERETDLSRKLSEASYAQVRALRLAKDLPGTEMALSRAILEFPSDPWPLREALVTAEEKGDWAACVNYAEELRRLFPTEIAGYISASRALSAMGMRKQGMDLLNEGIVKFPRQIAFYIERLRAALTDRNWNLVSTYASDLRERSPDNALGFTAGIQAARESGDIAKAGQIAITAQAIFDGEPWPLVERARLMEMSGDWIEAAKTSEAIRKTFPGHAIGYMIGLIAARKMDDCNSWSNLADTATTLFPHLGWSWLESIRLAIRVGDRPKALRLSDFVLENFSDNAESYRLAAQAKNKFGLIGEARDALSKAVERFPDAAWPLVEAGVAAVAQEDWEAAERLSATLRNAFPAESAGYTLGLKASLAMNRVTQAATILESAKEKFHDAPWFALNSIWIAQRLGDYDRAEANAIASLERNPDEFLPWLGHALNAVASPNRLDRRLDVALERLRQLNERFPNEVVGFQQHIRILREARLLVQAEDLFQAATVRFPLSCDLTIEGGKILESQGLYVEASSRYREVLDRAPTNLPAVIALTSCLCKLGQYDEAEQLCLNAISAHSGDPEPYREHVRIAMRRLDWHSALARASLLEERFSDQASRKCAYDARAGAAEVGSAIGESSASASKPYTHSNHAGDRNKIVIGSFESLGGTAVGCELGLVQRSFGVEPLGLLRWAHIEPSALIEAIDSGLEGVGKPEQTEVDTYDRGMGHIEYKIVDRRFGFYSHTFVMTDEVSKDRMFEQSCRRLQFLRRKLIDDLTNGEKLFAYKTHHRLSEEDLRRLRETFTRFGNPRLVCFQLADSKHPPGLVEFISNNFALAYMHRFAVTPPGTERAPDVDAWMDLATKVYDGVGLQKQPKSLAM